MAANESEGRGREPQDHRVDASGVFFNFDSPEASVTVIRANDVRVEDSNDARLLQLKSGSFLCNKRVYLVVDGQETEITVDPSPEVEPA